jgi:hypothetical protein
VWFARLTTNGRRRAVALPPLILSLSKDEPEPHSAEDRRPARPTIDGHGAPGRHLINLFHVKQIAYTFALPCGLSRAPPPSSVRPEPAGRRIEVGVAFDRLRPNRMTASAYCPSSGVSRASVT